MQEIYKKTGQSIKEEKAYTDEYRAIQEKRKETFVNYPDCLNEYIQSKPTTLVGLSLLVRQAVRRRDSDNPALYKDVYRKIDAGG